jgi:hypothetical protein
MAKQMNDTIFTGKAGNLVFYKMDDKGYVRRKSSLTGKQFKTQSRFINSRKSAERFGLGNRIAGEVYRSLPADERHYALFCRLKASAIQLLKEGKPTEAVKIYLAQTILNVHYLVSPF